jgi:hypothetical protein
LSDGLFATLFPLSHTLYTILRPRTTHGLTVCAKEVAAVEIFALRFVIGPMTAENLSMGFGSHAIIDEPSGEHIISIQLRDKNDKFCNCTVDGGGRWSG